MKSALLIGALLALVALGGCETLSQGSGAGTFRDELNIGRSDPVRQSLGKRLGAYIVERRSQDLPANDLVKHNTAAELALWTHGKGYGESWRDDATGASGTIVPTSNVDSRNGILCRHFHDMLKMPDEPVLGVDGTACFNGLDWVVTF